VLFARTRSGLDADVNYNVGPLYDIVDDAIYFATNTRAMQRYFENKLHKVPIPLRPCRNTVFFGVHQGDEDQSGPLSICSRKPAESSRALRTVSGPSARLLIELAREKHYSIIEIAELWALSEETDRKIFESKPVVIHWSTEEKLYKRGYPTLRVPGTVLYRVHRKLRRAS
jgi:hypothetical protein